MELEMRYIYTIYEYGSFSKAANALYITQPALSIAVQRVESRIGMPLFDRTSKPLKLTEAGEVYIEKYRRILDTENELAQQLNDLSGLKKGLLRVGGSHYFNSYILPPVINEFMRQYPGIQLEMIEAGSNDLLEMLYEHKIDLTFNCTIKPADSFHRIPCFQDTVLLTVPDSFPANEALLDSALTGTDILNNIHEKADCPAITMASFSSTPFILLTPGNNLFARSTVFFEEAKIKPQVKLHVTQLVTAWHLACAGVGAAFISDHLVKDAANHMLFYRVASDMATRKFDLCMSDRHYVSHAMKAFSSLFQSYYNKS